MIRPSSQNKLSRDLTFENCIAILLRVLFASTMIYLRMEYQCMGKVDKSLVWNRFQMHSKLKFEYCYICLLLESNKMSLFAQLYCEKPSYMERNTIPFVERSTVGASECLM